MAKTKLSLTNLMQTHAVLLQLKKRAEKGAEHLCLHLYQISQKLGIRAWINNEGHVFVVQNYVTNWISKALGESLDVETWAKKRGIPSNPNIIKQIRVSMVSHMLSQIEEEIANYSAI